MKRVLHILVTGYLAILLLFGTTSKEFIHVFTHHTDTVHPHSYNDGRDHIDGEHHHCSFLSFTLAPFANDHHFSFTPRTIVATYTVQHSELPVYLFHTAVAVHYLRGPPAC